VIVDIEQPEHPFIDQVYTAGGQINDARALKVGMTNASLFAYVADGKNGLRSSSSCHPRRPATPASAAAATGPADHGLIATYQTRGPAVALSKGSIATARSTRAATSGRLRRRGARPLTLAEQQRLYLRNGALYAVPELMNARRAEPFRRARGGEPDQLLT